jgi:hypothetical protein
MASFESRVKGLFHTEVTGFYPTGHGGVGEETEVTIPTHNIGKLVDLAREADAALAEVRRTHDLTVGLLADYKIREKRLERDIADLENRAISAEAALAAKDAEIARLQPRKIAPVQGYYPGIPWDMHLRAYAAYCKKWSPQKALVEGNCRGGFGTGELDEFIPGWLDELSERTRLTDLNTAKGELIEFYEKYIGSIAGLILTHPHLAVAEETKVEGERLRARIRSLEDE